MAVLLELPYDPSKRYLIFGDIHGRMDQVMDCLNKANYDSAKDIVMSVGDMIDRGPDSIAVVNNFKGHENWYSILGNHEHMVLTPDYNNIWLSNGGITTLDELVYYHISISEFQTQLNSFPYVIYVGDVADTNSFRLVHGEFPLVPDDVLYASLKAASPTSKLVENSVWSRLVIENRHNKYKLAQAKRTLTSSQIMTTFSGHSIVPDVYNIGCRYYIDTGMKKLTLIDAHTKEIWSSSI